MTLLELQDNLKKHPEDADIYFRHFSGSADEIELDRLVQIVLSAKIKKPKKPQPIKYLGENGGWTHLIKNAYVWEKHKHAQSCCGANKIDESQIKEHNGGFIITKPATL